MLAEIDIIFKLEYISVLFLNLLNQLSDLWFGKKSAYIIYMCYVLYMILYMILC